MKKFNGKSTRNIINATLFFSLPLSVFASEMNFDEVLSRIRDKNREVRIQALEIETQDFEVNKSIKEFLPTVSLETDKQLIRDEEEDRHDWTKDGGVELERVNVSIPIFTGFRNYNNYKKSVLQKDLSYRDNTLVQNETEERGIALYFEVLNNRRQTEISQAVIENLEKERERLSALFERGQMIPKSELLKVEADIEVEKARKNRRELEQRSAEEALFLLMGMSLDSDTTFTEYEVSDNLLYDYNLDRDVSQALATGSKAERERLLLEDADLNLSLARADLYPQVSGNYTYRVNKEDEDEFADYQVTLRATWEVFSWGSTIDDIRQKKIEKTQAELNYENQIEEISLEIRDKYREILALYDDLKSQESRLELLRENLEIDNLRYNNGLISSLDYLISVNDLSDTAATYYSLQRELVLRQREYDNLLK